MSPPTDTSATSLPLCPSCQRLGPGGKKCDRCRADDSLAAEQATYRPVLLVVRPDSKDCDTDVERLVADGVAVLRVPATASENVKNTAWGLCLLGYGRLLQGKPTAYALSSNAAGRDCIVRQLAEVGITIDRDDVAYALKKLEEFGTIECVGQMDDWSDQTEQEASRVRKSGAKLYALNVQILAVGQRSASEEALDPLRSCVSLGGIRLERLMRGAVNWAIRNAYEGNRNGIGKRLMWMCTKQGLTEDQATQQMRAYQKVVRWSGHEYTWTEARATVRSHYRHHG